MNRLLVLLVAFSSALLFQCTNGCGSPPHPIEPPLPTFGGFPSAGGASATGGSSTGGTAAGGTTSAGAGGVSPTVVADFPPCNAASLKVKPVVKFPLGRKRQPMRKRPKASYTILPNVEPRFWKPTISRNLTQRIGSCTGNAALLVRTAKPFRLATMPTKWAGVTDPILLEGLAEDIYSQATAIDPWPGSWPPIDTGSDCASAMTVAVQMGLFESTEALTTFTALQAALQTRPCVVGTDWTSDMWSPDRCGQIHASGTVEGGHAWAVVGIEFDRKLVWGLTSWGDGFGVKSGEHGGYFNVTFGDFQKLLDAGGEIECSSVPVSPP